SNGLSGILSIPGLAFAEPAIFTTSQSGRGQGSVLISNTAILAAPVGSVTGLNCRPARRGEYVSIYLTGAGPVSNPPATGAAAGSTPPSLSTLPQVFATIGGVAAPVSYAGLAPGFAGLYQFDVLVPLTTALGDAIPVAVSILGHASNTVTIAIQP